MLELTPAMRGFILHWGEMGTRWGINRTVAQIHALLYIAPSPLNAQQIGETLQVARSNVSNSLRELQSWGIVRITHVLGDRRDHFQSMTDVWEMFQIILDERKRRECDPTVARLRTLIEEAKNSDQEDPLTHQRLKELLGFFEAMTGWYMHLRRWPLRSVIKLVRSGDKVMRLLDGRRTGRSRGEPGTSTSGAVRSKEKR